MYSLEGDQEGGPEKGINLPEVTQPVGTSQGFFHSPDAGTGGTHRVGRSALSHGRSVSITVEDSCWVEGQSQTFHPMWGGGGGTAADLVLFIEHVQCPQSHLCQYCQSPSQKPTAMNGP